MKDYYGGHSSIDANGEQAVRVLSYLFLKSIGDLSLKGLWREVMRKFDVEITGCYHAHAGEDTDPETRILEILPL